MPEISQPTPEHTGSEFQKPGRSPSINTDDFKPYLEVVNGDSQRTRAAIYVLIASLLLIFTAYRNTTYPDWLDARLARLQHAAVCIEGNCNEGACKISKDYATDFLFQGDSTGKQTIQLGATKESTRQLHEQINAFIRERTDALSLRLPFFGIALDMNDLGMVCGLLLTAILYVLFASLKSEIDDLEAAHRKALRTPNKRDNLELLIMAQVLAPPSKQKLHKPEGPSPHGDKTHFGKDFFNIIRGIGVGQGLYVLFLLVPILQYFVVRNDWNTYSVAATLQGEKWATIETWVDVGAFGLVVVFSVCCIIQQWRLNNRLKGLSKEIESLGEDS